MQFSSSEIIAIVAVGTFIFLLAPIFLLIYIRQYNLRKIKDQEEKKLMAQQFESELLKTQIEVQEQTMQTIASNLHDNIGQLLSLTNITLGSININDTAKAETKINTSVELVNKSIKELRELAKLLQGEQLLQKGIGHAIEQEVNWLKKTEAYSVNFENGLDDSETPLPQTDLIILRLFQEIANNIIKHAQATAINIKLYQKESDLFLSVEENGIGFDYEVEKKKSSGLGLNTIEKKVALINGTISVQSSANKGTQILIQIPYC